MPDTNQYLGIPEAYWAYAFAVSGGFYAAVSWFGSRHLSTDANKTLTRWLKGEYKTTWSHHFCNLFDAVFGKDHLSLRCFMRSSAVSIFAVLLLYFLFSEIFGVMDGRASGQLSVWQAVLFGATINIIPDYLSLFETRWLLSRFERVRSILGQLSVLIADAIFTSAIIWTGISLFQIIKGDQLLSIVEMVALFSVFSLFFYSTFLTSLWAWVYCISTWLVRLFSQKSLFLLFDLEKQPANQIALVGAILIFFSSMLLIPAFKTTTDQPITAFDKWLCANLSADICEHLFRLTDNELQAVVFLAQSCERGTARRCIEFASEHFGGDEKISVLWEGACQKGYPEACGTLGFMYRRGRGVPQNNSKAVSYYRRACSGGSARGCSNLGFMYSDGIGVEKDLKKAVQLFNKTCTDSITIGCNNLGSMYEEGLGVEKNYNKASNLYRRSCNEENSVLGCGSLSDMYAHGRGTPKNTELMNYWLREALNKQDPNGQHLLAKYRAEDGKQQKLDVAEIFILRAIEQEPSVSVFWDTLAEILSKRGDHQDAYNAWDKALELSPDNKNILNNARKHGYQQ